MNVAAPAPAAAAPTRATALAALVALIVLGLAWELALAPTGRGTLALKVVPLFAFFPGLIGGRLRSYRWATLAIWPWFIEGVVRAASDRGLGQPLGAAEAALAIVFFGACAWHVRSRLRLEGPGA